MNLFERIETVGQRLKSRFLPATKLDLNQMEERIMSKITDLAVLEKNDLTAISAKLDDIVTGIAALDQKITDLSSGGISAADQAALDDLQATSKALLAKANAISTAPPA